MFIMSMTIKKSFLAKYFEFFEAACTNNTFGANCLEKCSPNCGGLNNACDNFNGFCFNGCDDGYLGERCGARKYKKENVVKVKTSW